MTPPPLPIPDRAHLIWLGPRLQALPYLAVRAALERGGLGGVALHYDDPTLAEDPLTRDLIGRAGFTLCPVESERLLAGAPPALHALYGRLPHPPSRANLLRLLILWAEGGIYLDTDAITLRDLTPLRAEEGFAGLERIVFPADLYASRSPLRWLRAGVLTALRDLIRRTARDPGAAFRRIERLYPLATNNAVLGSAPRHPMVRAFLDRAASMDDAEAVKRFRLGPQLLERVTGNRSQPGFRLFGPAAFYPLPPEICAAYVRDDPDGRLEDRPHPETYAAHLYDSVLRARLGRPLDAAYLRESRGRTLLTRMVEPYLDDLFGAAA